MKDIKYRTVRLPTPMVDAIEHIIKVCPASGYSSIAEFVKDSVRRRMEDFEFEEQ